MPEPGPLDGEAVQVRWARVCGRGPWRWGFLVALTVAVVTVVSAAVAATLAQPSWVTVTLSIVVAVPLVALLARAWVAGTYVSDRGIKVSRTLTTELVPWSGIADITTTRGSHWLGLPLRAGGERVVVTLADAGDAAGAADAGTDSAPASIGTHVETASPDLWLRPQAFDAAADRLRTWLRETRG